PALIVQAGVGAQSMPPKRRVKVAVQRAGAGMLVRASSWRRPMPPTTRRLFENTCTSCTSTRVRCSSSSDSVHWVGAVFSGSVGRRRPGRARSVGFVFAVAVVSVLGARPNNVQPGTDAFCRSNHCSARTVTSLSGVRLRVHTPLAYPVCFVMLLLDVFVG